MREISIAMSLQIQSDILAIYFIFQYSRCTAIFMEMLGGNHDYYYHYYYCFGPLP